MVRGVLSGLEAAVKGMDLSMADLIRVVTFFHPVTENIAVVADGDPFWGPFLKRILERGVQYRNTILGVEATLQGSTAEEALGRCVAPRGDLAEDAWRGLICCIALLSLLSSQEEIREGEGMH